MKSDIKSLNLIGKNKRMKTDSEIGPAYDPTQALKTDIFRTYELDDKQVDQYDLDKINSQ